MSHTALLRPIRDWLTIQALGEPDAVEMFDTLCRRLAGIGLPIKRARLIWPTLHPLFQAETVIWDLGKQAELEQFPHQDNETEAWTKSPLRFVLENNLDVLRRKLTGPDATIDFPMLEDLKKQGLTEYLVLATPMELRTPDAVTPAETSRGTMVSWSTERENGFSDDDVAAFQAIQQILAVAVKNVIQSRISRNIASTYLGTRAGRSVLEGKIRRGDGETTKAVVWYSDLRNSTMLGETMEADQYFDLLNAYYEATAAPLVEQGGEVLDFIGDAVLGIFPYHDVEDLGEAARQANSALDECLVRSKENNSERERQGLDRYQFGIGLNVGEVRFGNIGIPQRLSFSVIGPTVNEVARIESMTKLLQQPVLAGRTLAILGPDRWKSLGEHKLEGKLDPIELFAFRSAA